MRLTVIGLVALGLLAAVCAAVLLATLRAKRPSHTTVDPSTVETELVVAVRDLRAMSVVTGDAVEVRTVPLSEMPPNALRSAQAVVGRVLLAPMREGESFTKARFARDGSGVHLASVLQDGHRAMSVSLQDASGLDGLLYPGSIVDVVASFRMAVETEQGDVRGGDLISTVLLEAIQVLAIEDETIVSGAKEEESAEATTAATTAARNAGSRRRMVTLLVNPRQAEALQLAAGHGTIALALRNPLDLADGGRKGTSFIDLAPLNINRLVEVNTTDGQVMEAPAPTPAPVVVEVASDEPKIPAWRTVVIRGSTTVTQSFDEKGAPSSAAPVGASAATAPSAGSLPPR